MTIPDAALKAADNAIADAVGHTSSISTVMLASAALTAALPFLQGVKVKAMEWVKPPLSETLSRCETEFGTYRTWTHDEANGKWFWSVEGGYNEVTGEATDEEVAKAAAQADYETRILSAIEVAPSPRAQALEEGQLWQIATDYEASVGWTYLMSDIDQVRDQAALDCGYDATFEFTEAVMKIADARLRALSSHPVADGWLPIETAPKDTVVLMTWNYQGKWEYEAGIYGSTRGGWLHGQATHWRPLPASPEVAE